MIAENHNQPTGASYNKKSLVSSHQIFPEIQPTGTTPIQTAANTPTGSIYELNLDDNCESSTSSSSDLVLSPGEHTYTFCLWVPDSLEPSVKSSRIDIKYYLEVLVFTKKSSFLFSNIVKTYFPIDLYTLPQFLHLEQLEDSFEAPLCWYICKEYNTNITLSLSSRIIVNNSQKPNSSTLMIYDNSVSESSDATVKSIVLSLYQEITFNPLSDLSYKNSSLLFKKTIDFSKNSDDSITPVNQLFMCDLKSCSSLKKKKYYNITLPFVSSESLSSLVLDKFTARHFLRATVTLEQKNGFLSKTVVSESPILFITAKNEKFIQSLPTYSEVTKDYPVYNPSISHNELPLY
ncbi:hypothetical protein BB561_005972 [Smittium simulii]|uniref:Arrestin-like N-terminal domain-containing protein n=1 Tax=Smittium simulii TaxID=133385 RepID=A0A2T9Y7A2_9FUNG|nr:hypothetical protein BB561_005972 [Smittium simulii]